MAVIVANVTVTAMVEIRCRWCNAPRCKVPAGTPFEFRCCKLEQHGVA